MRALREPRQTGLPPKQKAARPTRPRRFASGYACASRTNTSSPSAPGPQPPSRDRASSPLTGPDPTEPGAAPAAPGLGPPETTVTHRLPIASDPRRRVASAADRLSAIACFAYPSHRRPARPDSDGPRAGRAQPAARAVAPRRAPTHHAHIAHGGPPPPRPRPPAPRPTPTPPFAPPPARARPTDPLHGPYGCACIPRSPRTPRLAPPAQHSAAQQAPPRPPPNRPATRAKQEPRFRARHRRGLPGEGRVVVIARIYL